MIIIAPKHVEIKSERKSSTKENLCEERFKVGLSPSKKNDVICFIESFQR